MERPVRGDVVVVPFPFSDLTNAKRRPALVLAPLQGDDLILCQVTSRLSRDAYSIALDNVDFLQGKLRDRSNIRPNQLFTADIRIVQYSVGRLNPRKFSQIIDSVVKINSGEGGPTNDHS